LILSKLIQTALCCRDYAHSGAKDDGFDLFKRENGCDWRKIVRIVLELLYQPLLIVASRTIVVRG